MDKRPLILVTNDDGVNAKGIRSLIEMVKPLGDVIVVAPLEPNSGMSHAITVKVPLRYKQLEAYDNVKIYGCTGTPVDSVKLAMSEIVPWQPDMVVSGINHGSNASISIVYSGTMAAVIEACIYKVPAIGFSLLDFSSNADFSGAVKFGRRIVENALIHGIPEQTCLNVNVPAIPADEIKGVKVCRQAKGMWKEEFDKRKDPRQGEYFWLTGFFEDHENGSTDTDEWALSNKYVSIVPVKVDFTHYEQLEYFKNWNYGTQD